jgi:hypothetical protein
MKIIFQDYIAIQASNLRVWEALSNWENPRGWVPQLKSCTILNDTSRTRGVGAVRRIIEEDQTLVERVISWNEPHTLGIQVEGVPPIVRNVVTTFSVTPLVHDSCRFKVHCASDTGLSLIGIAFAPFAKRAQRQELRRLLVAMKYFVETGKPATHQDVDHLMPSILSFR